MMAEQAGEPRVGGQRRSLAGCWEALGPSSSPIACSFGRFANHLGVVLPCVQELTIILPKPLFSSLSVALQKCCGLEVPDCHFQPQLVKAATAAAPDLPSYLMSSAFISRTQQVFLRPAGSSLSWQPRWEMRLVQDGAPQCECCRPDLSGGLMPPALFFGGPTVGSSHRAPSLFI